MARLGLTPREFAAFRRADRPRDRLARGDQPSGLRRRARASAERAQQRARFAAVAARCLGVPASLAASSGIFLGARIISIWCVRAPRSTASTRCRAAPTRCAQLCGSTRKSSRSREIDSGEIGWLRCRASRCERPAGSPPSRSATPTGGCACFSQRGCGYIGGKRVPVARPSVDGSR